jgi:hypothetical protein
MAFDIQGALKEGYSLPEIVDYLGGQKKFDVAGARSEGYSDQEILDFLSPKKKEEGIGTALRRGAEQLVSTGQTALESITKGGEEAAIRGRERQADIQARLGEGASLERLLETYRQQGLLAAGKELAGQIPSAIAEQVPGIATTLAGAGAGAAAGSVVPGVGTVIGGLAGAVAPSLIQQYGGNIQRQAEAQAATGKPLQIERGTAAATAVPQAALDVAATFIPLGGRLASSVFGPKVGQMLMQSSAEGREKLFKESLLSTVLKGTAVGVAAEVPTEVVQTMLERAQADLPVLTDDALREYGEVAFATSLLGPIGIIGRVSNKAEAGRRLAEAQQKAIDTNELQQVEIQTEEKEEPTVLFVSPSGDVAQSLEQLDEINKIKQQQGMPQQRTVTESYASEEDRIAAEKAAYDRARKYSPTMQALDKLVEDRKAREQAQIAKIDEMKAAQSAFSTAEPVAGLYRPPTAEEIAIEEEKAKQFTNTRTVMRKTPEGIKVYEGTMNKTGTAVNVIENGKKLTFNPNNPNIVIDPTEKDIYRFETDSMADEARALSGKVEEAKIKFNKSALEFKQWLRDPKHQLKQEVFSDTIAPRKRTKEDQFRALSPKVSKGFFAKKPGEGLELDMAAEMAFDAGFLSADEFYNPEDPDGREAFTEKLKAAYDNEPVVTPRSADLYSDYETINQQLRNLEDEIDRRKESLAQESPEVVGELTPEEQEAEAARVAEASTRYEKPLPSDKFIQEGLDLAIEMRDALDKMGLKNVGLQFEDYMSRYLNGELKEVTGSYFENLIKVSLSSTNVKRTLNHEALHAMRDIGLFSDAEWKILSNKAKSQWIKKYDPDGSRYGSESMEVRIEEAIADAFADYRTQPANIKTIFDKIIDLMDMIRNYFAGRGFRTVDDVFQKAETGGLDGQGTLRQWEELYEIKPPKDPLTDQEITNTSWSDQIANKLFANRELPDGTNVMVRLNLNGVVKRGDQKMHLTTIHEPFSQKRDGSFSISVKNAIGYDGVVTIRNVNFIINQKARADIFKGESKLPMGGAQGEIVQGVRDLEGTRITFNPAREHLFVRVDDGRPVKYADELTMSDTDVFVRGNVEYYTPENMPQPLDDLPTAANFDGIPLSETKVKRGEIPAKKEQKELFEVPTRAKVRAPLAGVDPAYADKLLKQFTAEKATVKQRFEGLKENFFERMVIGVFDEFRTIKKYSDEAYMMARMSKSIDGGLQGLLEHGEVFNDGGALNIRPGTKGLLKILEPLGTEVDQYQMWKALNRDANLPADKRSFDPELLDGRDQLAKGQLNGKSRRDIYEKALKEEQALNRSVLKVALDAGIIDKAGYDRFAQDIYYIPFYKAMEDGDVSSISASSKLTGQEFSKALKGGPKKVNDLMENVLMNWSHILSAAMKNQAADATLKAAEDMGVAKVAKPVNGKYPPNTVKVMRDGKTAHIEIEDVGLVDAISTISYLGPKSMFLDVAKHFTNALRYGVTLSPAYKLRNLIRDSISSAAVSPLSKNLYQNVYNGLKMSDKGNPTYMSALASGGIFEMGVAHEGNQAKLIKRLVDKGVDYGTILDSPEKVKGVLQSALDWYNTQGNRFENANRLALYDKLMKEGKTHLEASFQARDLMDFSMQGQFRAVKVLSSVVPFFNARLQGLYKLGRDGITPTYRLIYNTTTGKEVTASDKQKAQRFMTISGAVMLASMALYGMYKDDEEFKKREDWDRDNFWWFKVGDTKFRIPKPFEIGALGTMAERTLEQISDDKVEGKVFFNRLNHILMDTFALNPIPQMVKPMIDLYSNKDSFTGAPIVSAGMERLSAQERVTNRTSGVAQALGGISAGMHKVLTFNPDAQGMSPVQIDYAIKAYLGWAGSTAVATADLAVEPFTEGTRVRKPVIDTLAMGFIKTEPETASKFMTEFYETNARVQSALADMRHYAELGDSEKVGKILRDQGDDIALAKLYDKTSKQLAEIRKQMRLIEQSKDIDTEDKRAEMNRLRILMSKMTENVEGMRKSLKQ